MLSLQERYHIRGARRPREAMPVASGLLLTAERLLPWAPPDNVLFIFRFSTTKQTRSLAVKLTLLCPNTATKKLTEIISLFGWYLGSVHRFGCGKLVDACRGFDDASHVVASVSRFSPVGKPQSLPALVKPPAFRSIQQSQVRSLLPREELGRLPVPTHPLLYAVHCSHWPITHFTTTRTATLNSLKLRKSLWSLLSHASQMSQTLICCILQGIDDVTCDEKCQHKFTTSASAFRAPQCCDQPEGATTRKETKHGRRPNQTRNQAGFRLKRQRCPTNASGDGVAVPDLSLRNIIGHSSCTSELNPK